MTDMEYDFEDPNFDFAGNAEIIAAKLRKARAMQNVEAPQGVSAPGVFAMSRPDIGGAIQRGVGRYEQAQAEQARGSMNTEQLRRYDELSRGMNEMKPVDYSNPDEAVLENSRRMALAGQMAKLNLPMAQKAAETYLGKGAAFPETIAKMRMDQIERGEQNAMKLREIEAQKERDRISREEMQKDRFAQQEAMARLGAALRPAPVGPSELDIALKEERLKKMREEKPAKPPTTAQLKQEAINEAPDRIGNIIETAKKNEDAFGVVPAAASMLPNFIGSRITSKALTPEQRQARADVMRQAAQEIHALYGAALSRGEAGRANSFAPNPNDDYESVMSKLKSAQNYAKSISKSSGIVKPTGDATTTRRKYNQATGEFE